MPFGLNNAPSTFQNMMNNVFLVHICCGNTDTYINDLILGTLPHKGQDNDKYHIEVMKTILQTFRENKLFLKLEKCVFSQTYIKYLSYVVSKDHVMMDPTKVSAILDWPIPKDLKQTCSFLGFLNYYRQFIHEFTQKAQPLNDLTKKDVPFVWGEAQEKAFEELKLSVTSAPVLILPDLEKPFTVETNTSLIGYGAILSQEFEGKLHPVAFLSYSFTETEWNYSTHNRELLAVLNSFKHWHAYLYGSPHTITVLSDHKALKFFRSAHTLQRHHARWKVKLNSYNYVIKYCPGTASGQPDTLSQQANFNNGKEDNKEEVIIPKEYFINSLEDDSIISLTEAISHT